MNEFSNSNNGSTATLNATSMMITTATSGMLLMIHLKPNHK